jgi:hypothetical protein
MPPLGVTTGKRFSPFTADLSYSQAAVGMFFMTLGLLALVSSTSE